MPAPLRGFFRPSTVKGMFLHTTDLAKPHSATGVTISPTQDSKYQASKVHKLSKLCLEENQDMIVNN